MKSDITQRNGGYNYSPYFFVLTFVQFESIVIHIILEYMNTIHTCSS